MPALYIADGHHRAASAARAQGRVRDGGTARPSLGDGADYNTFLGVAFPHDQVRILPYNRIVKDSAGLTPRRSSCRPCRSGSTSTAGPAAPAGRGEIAMYCRRPLAHAAAALDARKRPTRLRSLDVSVLQEQLLAPVLGIGTSAPTSASISSAARAAPRSSRRWSTSGKAAVAFSMFPVSVAD